MYGYITNKKFAQWAGAVEYTDCPAYDTKQSDGEVPVMLGPGVILSISSLSLLPDVVAPDRALSIG